MREAIISIMDKVTDEFVITSTGTISREVFNYKDRERNFYVMGSLGAALGIGLGLALNTEKKVVMINKFELKDLKKCLGHLTHELAHSTGASDMTERMMHEVGNVAGTLLYPFVKQYVKPSKREVY